jgi:hypothetical protein
MSIPFPQCIYPATLEERGPKEDPSILLAGMAEIGDAPALIIAIRVSRTLRSTPDYRQDIPAEVYRVNNIDAGLETFLENSEDLTDELSDALGEHVPSIIQMEPGLYRLWILPLALGSASSFDKAPFSDQHYEA